MRRELLACALLLLAEAAGWQVVGAPQAAARPRVRVQMMGRAEKRMAKKRKKKGPLYEGGRPVKGVRAARNDVLSKQEVLQRLGEIPVFGIEASPTATTVSERFVDGTFYCMPREAERACEALRDPNLRVEGIPLSEVYFDSTTRLKPSDSAVRELKTVEKAQWLVPDVSIPIYCIDGLATSDKRTGVASLPLFLSKQELLQFAVPVYGSQETAQKVLVSDLGVMVDNMLRGPVGPLRDGKFFPDAKALAWMDERGLQKQKAMFPGLQAKSGGSAPSPNLFPGSSKQSIDPFS